MTRREWCGLSFRDLDDDDPRPLGPSRVPPDALPAWTEDQFARWDAAERAAAERVDAWERRHPWRHLLDRAAQ